MATLSKKCWTRVLGYIVIQLNTDEYMPNVDRAYSAYMHLNIKEAGHPKLFQVLN